MKSLFLGILASVFVVQTFAQESEYSHLFSYYGTSMTSIDGEERPWTDGLSGDTWLCMAAKAFGSTSERQKMEDVFAGRSALTENVYNAGKECGLLALMYPLGQDMDVQYVDKEYPITYNTSGITAIAGFSRPPGIEQLADPSVVLLDDNRLALYFAGDHRQANQSTRWVTTQPITSINDPLVFELEEDYNLPTKLLWRMMFYDGESWEAYGTVQDNPEKFTSSDGLSFSPVEELILTPSTQEVRLQEGLHTASQSNAFISITKISETEIYGVVPNYREGFEAQSSDPNGNGYEDPPYVLIYQWKEDNTWEYKSHFIGISEAYIDKHAENLYSLALISYDGATQSIYNDKPVSNGMFYSTDMESWSFGVHPYVRTGASGRHVVLEDNSVLYFGTESQTGIPSFATKATFDASVLTSRHTLPMTFANLPTVAEIEQTIGNNSPEVITLTSPGDGSNGVSLSPTLEWNQDSNSNSYTLQVSTDGFESFVVNESLTQTSFNASALQYNTQYSWRVRGTNSTGDGEWSDVWTFTTQVEQLNPSTPLSPEDGQENVGTLTKFNWSVVNSASSYLLQVSTDSSFTTQMFQSAELDSTTHTLVDPLRENTQYYWRVRSLGEVEEQHSEWSEVMSFTTGVRTSVEVVIPTEYSLSQNYPNPFNPTTTITYSLPKSGIVTLNVYDMTGRFITTLVNSAKGAGMHTVEFDASSLSSGVYVYTLETEGYKQTRQMLLVK